MSATYKCRSCGAPIIWIKTRGGKSMPCDADPIPYLVSPGCSDKLVTPGGDMVSCEIVTDPTVATAWGYKPHWSTCNNPEKFRKGR